MTHNDRVNAMIAQTGCTVCFFKRFHFSWSSNILGLNLEFSGCRTSYKSAGNILEINKLFISITVITIFVELLLVVVVVIVIVVVDYLFDY